MTKHYLNAGNPSPMIYRRKRSSTAARESSSPYTLTPRTSPTLKTFSSAILPSDSMALPPCATLLAEVDGLGLADMSPSVQSHPSQSLALSRGALREISPNGQIWCQATIRQFHPKVEVFDSWSAHSDTASPTTDDHSALCTPVSNVPLSPLPKAKRASPRSCSNMQESRERDNRRHQIAEHVMCSNLGRALQEDKLQSGRSALGKNKAKVGAGDPARKSGTNAERSLHLQVKECIDEALLDVVGCICALFELVGIPASQVKHIGNMLEIFRLDSRPVCNEGLTEGGIRERYNTITLTHENASCKKTLGEWLHKLSEKYCDDIGTAFWAARLKQLESTQG